MIKKDEGPVEILCDEIGVSFQARMESTPVLVAFVAALVGEVDFMIQHKKNLAPFTGEEVPTEDTYAALECVKSILPLTDREELIKAAGKAHDTVRVPDEGPCNHHIDMLSLCTSAIRFGLEQPCWSRHAAEAAHHVWKHRYGITLFDGHSNGWGKQWAKAKFLDALNQANDQ